MLVCFPIRVCFLFLASILACASLVSADDRWVRYEGQQGAGKGKHVVLVSGDEEYRSEEGLPQLARILAQRHGFDCTVLFALDDDGTINPNRGNNIPGLEALRKADLLVILARFRDLPDDQRHEVADYVESDRPVSGRRSRAHDRAQQAQRWAAEEQPPVQEGVQHADRSDSGHNDTEPEQPVTRCPHVNNNRTQRQQCVDTDDEFFDQRHRVSLTAA